MYIYGITYLINSLGFFLDKKNQKYVCFLVLGMLIFLSGTRYYMGGSDVYVYEGVYNNVASIKEIFVYIFTGVNTGVNVNYERGFLLFCSLCKTLGFSYFGFILIYSIIFYTFMYNGLKSFVPNWAAFFAVFMYKLMFYNTFISIRQGMTLAIFCLMLKFIRDRKWYIYFILCCCAFFEHNGAIILFPLYFINYVPITKKFIRNFAILMAPLWFLRSKVDLSGLLYSVAEVIGNTHSVEHWMDSTEVISIIHTIECYLVVILILMFYDKIMSNKRTEEAKLVLRLFLITIPIFTLFSNWIVLTREKDYFVLMYGIIFGFIIDGGSTTVEKHKKSCNKQLSKIGVNNFRIISVAIILACFIGMTRYVMVFDGGELIKYRSFVFEDVNLFNNKT